MLGGGYEDQGPGISGMRGASPTEPLHIPKEPPPPLPPFPWPDEPDWVKWARSHWSNAGPIGNGGGPGIDNKDRWWTRYGGKADDWASHGGNEKGYLNHLAGHSNGGRPGQIDTHTGEVRPYPPPLGPLAQSLQSHYNFNGSGLEDVPNTPGIAERHLARWINRGRVGSIDESGVTRAAGPNGATPRITFDAGTDEATIAGLRNLNTLRGAVRTAEPGAARRDARWNFRHAAYRYGTENKPPPPAPASREGG